MRYAIISDLHANIEALERVLCSIDQDRVQQVVCLGDLVGYNARPNECVELVRRRRVRCLAGNHDRAAIGSKDPSDFGAGARRAIEWTKSELRPEHREYLQTLATHELVDGRFFAVHGALHPEPNDQLHLSNDVRVQKSFDELVTGRFGAKICFFGHTHRAVAYEHARGAFRRLGDRAIELHPEAHYLINPGSVGQPRDGDPRAAYAVFDDREMTVELRRVEYDVARNLERTRSAGLLREENTARRSVDWLLGQMDKVRDYVAELGLVPR